MNVTISFPDVAMLDAFAGALQDLGYTYKRGIGDKQHQVIFTFDTPKTFQPRTAPENADRLNMVNNANAAVVAKYKSFNLANNDPNNPKIPDALVELLSQQLSVLSTSFTQILADAWKQVGKSASEVVTLLQNQFGVAKETITDIITRAGYSLSDWVATIARGLNLDFSCAVEIDNRGDGALNLAREDYGAFKGNWPFTGDCGSYVIDPPAVIRTGETGRFLMQRSIPHGAEGWVKYSGEQAGGKQTVKFSYRCPTGKNNNEVRIESGLPFNFRAATGQAGSWGPINSVDKEHHPLKVVFLWGSSPPRPI